MTATHVRRRPHVDVPRTHHPGRSFFVRFPDIPEALASGDSREEVLAEARDALETAMEFYFEDIRAVPVPSEPKRGQVLVELRSSIAAKVLLLNSMIEERVSAAELALRLGTAPRKVNRIVTLRYPTKIGTIALALRALGRRLTLSVD